MNQAGTSQEYRKEKELIFTAAQILWETTDSFSQLPPDKPGSRCRGPVCQQGSYGRTWWQAFGLKNMIAGLNPLSGIERRFEPR